MILALVLNVPSFLRYCPRCLILIFQPAYENPWAPKIKWKGGAQKNFGNFYKNQPSRTNLVGSVRKARPLTKALTNPLTNPLTKALTNPLTNLLTKPLTKFLSFDNVMSNMNWRRWRVNKQWEWMHENKGEITNLYQIQPRKGAI